MKTWCLARYTFGVAVGAALLAGCSAAETPSVPTGGAPASLASSSERNLSPQIQSIIAMTRADHRAPLTARAVRVTSWMKHVPAGTPLLYVSDNGFYPPVVDVFNYSTGSMVGQVAGSFEYLYNPCSDKAGNVYVPDFESGTVYEIQHRTTNVINSWAGNGYPIGCSVSRSGDLAVSAFSYGGGQDADGAVIIYPGGGPSGTVQKGPGNDWPATYDEAGNLFVQGDYKGQCTSPCIAELPKGGNSWKILSYNRTIFFPGAVELMGKVLGVGDQEAGGSSATAIYATKVSGKTAKATNATTLSDGSCSDGNALGGWANVSTNPNGLQIKKVTGVVGANHWCGTLNKWKFPAGGNPTGRVNGAATPNGATLIK